MESKIDGVPVMKGTLGRRGEVAVFNHVYEDVGNSGKRRPWPSG